MYIDLKNNCDNVYFDFANADYITINNALYNINWLPILNCTDVNLCVDIFYCILYEIIEKFVPQRKYYKKNYPSWFDSTLINLITKKRRAHTLFKITNSPVDYQAFSVLRKNCKTAISVAENTYINNVEHGISDDIKTFWKFVRDNSKDMKSIPNYIRYGETLASDGYDISNLFMNFFSSVYSLESKLPNNNLFINESVDVGMFNITAEIISNSISKLKTSVSSGPDRIPSLFLKMCSNSLIIVYRS